MSSFAKQKKKERELRLRLKGAPDFQNYLETDDDDDFDYTAKYADQYADLIRENTTVPVWADDRLNPFTPTNGNNRLQTALIPEMDTFQKKMQQPHVSLFPTSEDATLREQTIQQQQQQQQQTKSSQRKAKKAETSTEEGSSKTTNDTTTPAPFTGHHLEFADTEEDNNNNNNNNKNNNHKNNNKTTPSHSPYMNNTDDDDDDFDYGDRDYDDYTDDDDDDDYDDEKNHNNNDHHAHSSHSHQPPRYTPPPPRKVTYQDIAHGGFEPTWGLPIDPRYPAIPNAHHERVAITQDPRKITTCYPNMDLLRQCVVVTNHEPAFRKHADDSLIRPRREELCRHFVEDYSQCVDTYIKQRVVLTGLDPQLLPKRDQLWIKDATETVKKMEELMSANIPQSNEDFEHNRTRFTETEFQLQEKEKFRNMWRYATSPEKAEQYKREWRFHYDKFLWLDNRWNEQVRYRGEELIDAKMKKPIDLTQDEWDAENEVRGHQLFPLPRSYVLDTSAVGMENQARVLELTHKVDPLLRATAYGFLKRKLHQNQKQYDMLTVEEAEDAAHQLGIGWGDEYQWK